MNKTSALTPVGGSLSRMKKTSRWPSSLVIGEKFRFCLSHCPPSRGIATNNHNQNWKKNLCASVAVTRSQSSTSQTTATVSDQNNEDDDIHRYRYQLYKYKICPFSNIAKVLLEYQKIPFESIEVNPLTKEQLGFSEKYRKVPIVTILDSASTTPAAKAFQQLNGTEEILPHDYQLSEIGIIDDEFASRD